MAITLVGFAGITVSSSATANLTLPGGSAVGDIAVLAAIGFHTDTTVASGFTQVDLQQSRTVDECRTATRTLDATDISNGFVVVPGSAGFNETRYSMWVVNGATVDVVAGTNGIDFTSPDTVCTIASVTTTVASDLVLVITGGRQPGTSWGSLPGGNTTDSTNIGSLVSVYAAHFTAGGAGATGTQTATNVGASNKDYVSCTVALYASGAPAVVAPFTFHGPGPFRAPSNLPTALQVWISGRAVTGTLAIPAQNQTTRRNPQLPVPGLGPAGPGFRQFPRFIPGPTLDYLFSVLARCGFTTTAVADHSVNVVSAAATSVVSTATISAGTDVAVVGVVIAGVTATATATADRTATINAATAGTITGTAAHDTATTVQAATGATAATAATHDTATTAQASAGVVSTATISAGTDVAVVGQITAGVVASAVAGHNLAATSMIPAGDTATVLAAVDRAITSSVTATAVAQAVAAHNTAATINVAMVGTTTAVVTIDRTTFVPAAIGALVLVAIGAPPPTLYGPTITWREPSIAVYAEPGNTTWREAVTAAGYEPGDYIWREPSTTTGSDT